MMTGSVFQKILGNLGTERELHVITASQACDVNIAENTSIKRGLQSFKSELIACRVKFVVRSGPCKEVIYPKFYKNDP